MLTGETGAGKSLLLGSVNIALGNKVSKDIIRNGEDFALVELTFSTKKNKPILSEIWIFLLMMTILLLFQENNGIQKCFKN